MKKCSITGCRAKYYAKGFCKKHYHHNHLYGDPLVYKKGFTVEEKFWKKVDKRDHNECWPWIACRGNFGYGMMGFKKNGRWKQEGAHRISWRIHFGEIPEGMNVLHRCDNPPCVNPSHLFIGSLKDNLDDMRTKGRHRPKRMDRSLICGHPHRKFYSKGMCRACYMRSYHNENEEELRKKQRMYLDTHKKEKAAYDKARRESMRSMK